LMAAPVCAWRHSLGACCHDSWGAGRLECRHSCWWGWVLKTRLWRNRPCGCKDVGQFGYTVTGADLLRSIDRKPPLASALLEGALARDLLHSAWRDDLLINARHWTDGTGCVSA